MLTFDKAKLRQQLNDVLVGELSTLQTLRRQLSRRLKELDAREDQYLDLLGTSGLPHDKIKQKLTQLAAERILRGRVSPYECAIDDGHRHRRLVVCRREHSAAHDWNAKRVEILGRDVRHGEQLAGLVATDEAEAVVQRTLVRERERDGGVPHARNLAHAREGVVEQSDHSLAGPNDLRALGATVLRTVRAAWARGEALRLAAG